jgi:methionyl aminopeptidase
MIHLKSAREIDLLRASADLVSRTLAEVGRHVRPGVTTAHLDQVAEAFIRSRGARPSFKGYRMGGRGTPFPGAICASVNDVVVHGIPGPITLQEGDLIAIDCGVELNGYYGDSAYTFAVGTISPEAAALCRTTYEALYQGIREAVAGKRVGDISEAVQRSCERQGYGVVRDLVGHGIGRNMHEDPQVPNYGRRGEGKKLKEGLVICIEPMINRGTHEVSFDDDDGWTVRTLDREPSAHYEHTVVIRRGQPEILTTFAYIEEVLDVPPYQLQHEEVHV